MDFESRRKSRRAPAILALVVAFVAVVAVLAISAGGSGGGDDGGGSDQQQVGSQPATQKGQEALARGFYVVGKGDTLSQIAADTGLDEATLTELNPEIDPQALIPGQKIRLR